MAVTFKQLLNRALRIAGEDEITSATNAVSDTQHLLVAEVANEIKEEVEAAHNWRALRQTVTVAFSASETSNTITEANERSRIVRDSCGRALAHDITDSSNPNVLYEIDLADLLYRRTMDPDTTDDPFFFALDNSSGDAMKIHVHPKPADSRTIQLVMIIPQDRLDASDSTDLATNIKIPVRPITLGLVRWILEERGEELGINSQYSEEKEFKALQDAISLDLAESGGNDLVIK